MRTFDKTNQKDNNKTMFGCLFQNIIIVVPLTLSHISNISILFLNNEHKIYVAIEMSFIEMTRSFYYEYFFFHIPLLVSFLQLLAGCCGNNCEMRTHFLVAGLKLQQILKQREVWHQKFLVQVITHPATQHKPQTLKTA
jgi:hypothetical protein